MENGLIAATESDIQNLVYSIRGKKVMFDSDLGKIYGVTTSRLNEQVKRNLLRFLADFMFQLSKQEWADLMSQNAISNVGEDLMSQNAITGEAVYSIVRSAFFNKQASGYSIPH